jgi:ceramide glucosyltransferase
MLIAYYIFAAFVVLIQFPILLEAYRHFHYTRKKYRPKPSIYQPKAALICPCKGIDTTFERNIESLFQQEYSEYEIFFVVESTEDPAYERLAQIIQRQESAAGMKARITVAGKATTCAQKVHNLSTVCRDLPEEYEVFVFVDSDACMKSHFLSSLVHPLRRREMGASTGYRWYIPVKFSLCNFVLSAMNAAVASSLGPHDWNCTWGGAMAIRRDIFLNTQVATIWQNACTDDLPLTRAIKDAGLKVAFVPACFVASYEDMSWGEFFSFARRQFLITRVCMPRLWDLALVSWGYFALAFWTGFLLTLWLVQQDSDHAYYAGIMPGFLLAVYMAKAIIRQVMIQKILPEDRVRLLPGAVVDIFFGPIIAVIALVFLIASACSRTVVWRGIQYRLHDYNHTEITALSSDA